MIEVQAITGMGAALFLTLGVIRVIQGDLGAAVGNVAAGLSLGALLLWARRRAPHQTAANR